MLVSDTKLSTSQILLLAGRLEGHPLKRVATKGDAIKKLYTSCVHRLGADQGKQVYTDLTKVEFDAAEKIISIALDPTTSLKPTAATAEVAVANGRVPEDQAGKRATSRSKLLTTDHKENHRRPGSFGHKSFAIILANPQGITIEEFLKAGGRMKDLNWDAARGYVSVSPSK